MRSIKPFSSTNSARWNPGGRSSPMVWRMTRAPAKPTSAPGRGVLDSRLALRVLDAIRISHLGIAELERVGGDEIGEALDERVVIDEITHVGTGGNAEVEVAVRAGPEIFFEHGLEQCLAA